MCSVTMFMTAVNNDNDGVTNHISELKLAAFFFITRDPSPEVTTPALPTTSSALVA